MAKTDYKLPQKMWFIHLRNNNRSDDNENLGNNNLAYMTYLEYAKDNQLNSQTKKRLSTGYNWATRKYDLDNVYDFGVPFDNEPITGFYIGDSVSRWTTDNKLFRVIDPRGFTIEISTGNIATLLHYTTVVNGYVQEPCVYCYEAGKHFLLPVNSELYQEVAQEISDYEQAKKNIISPRNLIIGKMYEKLDGGLGYYLGKFNITWHIKCYEETYRYYYSSQPTETKLIGSESILDPKVHLFIPYEYRDNEIVKDYYKIQDSLNPKFYREVEYNATHSLELNDIAELLKTKWIPDRIVKRMKYYNRSSRTSYDATATLERL